MKVKMYASNFLGNLEDRINEFIYNKDVIDIKIQVVNKLITVLILYKEV